MGQVGMGRLSSPIEIGNMAAGINYPGGPFDIAFRYEVQQVENLRACDDLKQAATNLYFATWTPVKLPTWGRIAQMCSSVGPEPLTWPFFKAGPSRARLEVLDLTDFAPKASSFAAASADLH